MVPQTTPTPSAAQAGVDASAVVTIATLAHALIGSRPIDPSVTFGTDLLCRRYRLPASAAYAHRALGLCECRAAVRQRGRCNAVPGVAAVWTAADIDDLPPIDFRDPAAEALRPYRQPLLARERLR